MSQSSWLRRFAVYPMYDLVQPFCGIKKCTTTFVVVHKHGCGGRTRTYDLRVMSPTSFQLLYSAIFGCAPLVLKYYSTMAPPCQEVFSVELAPVFRSQFLIFQAAADLSGGGRSASGFPGNSTLFHKPVPVQTKPPARSARRPESSGRNRLPLPPVST